MPHPHLKLGAEAETLAERYLVGRKFRILTKNWRRPWGELDIVARRGGTLHFVEVKGQERDRPGFDAWRRANRTKLMKVARTARTWMAHRRYPPATPWQIDIIHVSVHRTVGKAHITHFKNVAI